MLSTALLTALALLASVFSLASARRSETAAMRYGRVMQKLVALEVQVQGLATHIEVTSAQLRSLRGFVNKKGNGAVDSVQDAGKIAPATAPDLEAMLALQRAHEPPGGT